MEFNSIVEFFENKAVLVTGATGFLAKIFVEKLLRTQPNVKKLYLLLRAKDSKSSMQRFENEIVGKELFRVLKEKERASFDTFMSQKVTVVPGDISLENLGIKEANLRDEMLNGLHVIVNLAATTDFDERYDVALNLNTFGAMHVLNFAKKCVKLELLAHVSTAYVAGEKEGVILEKPFSMGETLNGTTGLDIDAEKKLVDNILDELQSQNATQEKVKSTMKELGIQRAKLYGWPNTYVFTKAMGEMVLGNLNENLPLVIIRPSIVTSTYKEPFPGWIEGLRTVDGFILAYGKGKLPCFVGDPDAFMDVVPADMVVNAMIVAIASHANRPCHDVIYHVGSSSRNPLKFHQAIVYGYRYFINKPWVTKDGETVKYAKITVLRTMDSFNTYMMFRGLLPLKGLQFANTIFCRSFQGLYTDFNKKINFVTRLIQLYKPYLFFQGIFDDKNTEELRMATKRSKVDENLFYFDPTCINWEDYSCNTHIPGLIKYVLK